MPATAPPPRGVVAAGHPETVAAAAATLRAGGNAFDAAIAAGFAAAVVEPCLSSLAGGGFLLARTPSEAVVFDFFVDTPGRGVGAARRPVLDPVTLRFGAADQVFHVGHGSVAVPGSLPGYLHVHRRLGRLPLAEVVAPARALAAAGAPLGADQTAVVHLLEPILTRTAEGRGRFRPDGTRLTADTVVRNAPLAAFLGRVADGEVTGFDAPGLAAAIAADMADHGGLLSAEDLAAYRVVERAPLRVAHRDAVLLTNPPPSHGGGLIAAALTALAAAGPPAPAGSGTHLVRLTEALVEVTRAHLDTAPADTAPADTVPPDAVSLRGAATEGDPSGEAAVTPERPPFRSVRGTTHVSVCDDEGNLASMTTSNGSCSGVYLADTGAMANNIMGEADLHPHLRGTGPEVLGQRLPAGRRVGSMMAPSVLLRTGRPPVAFGSGGSERIRSAMTQVVVALVDHDADVAAAVRAPRLHWDGHRVQAEPGFDPDAIAALRRRWDVNVWDVTDLYFGGTHVAGADGSAAGDHRRGGAAAAVPAPA